MLGAPGFVVAILVIGAPVQAAKQGSARCAGKKADQIVDPKRGFAGSSARGEVIVGSHQGDRIRGQKGPDRFCGRKEADRISGGAGHDVVRGGKGRDTIRGGRGHDRIDGGRGHDWLSGGPGRDRIKGGRGHDRLSGGPGRDWLRAGRGRDRIDARDGARDEINCGPGRDTVRVDNRDVLRGCERVTLEAMPAFGLPAWSDGLWSDPSSYETIVTGDIDGDGVDELLGRSPGGIEAYSFDKTTGNWLPLYTVADPELSDAEGWDAPEYYSTIQLGDIDGDGKDELLARGAAGVEAWDYSPQSQSWSALPTNQDLSDSERWNQAEYYTTIQTGDIDGDGRQELLARAYAGMDAWKFTGQSWDKLSATGRPFTDDGGWGHPEYYSTIQAADIDGDGADEVIGRDNGGLVEYKFTNGGWTALPPLGKFPDNPWEAPQYYSTIQTGDLVGDGKAEVFARAPDGLRAYSFEGGDWSELPELGVFTDASGWSKPQYYSTIQTARLLPFEGSRIDFVIARGPGGLQAYWLPGGEDWEPYAPVLGDLSDPAGWENERYYATIHTANGIETKGADAIVARGLAGVQSYGYDLQRKAWETFSADFASFTGEEQDGYAAISDELSPGGDLRRRYATMDTHDFEDSRITLEAMQQPPDVDDADAWAAVKGQINDELVNAGNAADWYENYLTQLTETIFVAESMDATAQVIGLDTKKDIELVMQTWAVFTEVLTDIGWGVGLLGPEGAVAAALIGGGTATGMGAPDIDAAIDTTEATYIELREQLQDNFTSAIDGLGDAKTKIVGDYGLQSAVGGSLIGNGRWTMLEGEDEARAIAGGERAYAIVAWRTMASALWAAINVKSDSDSIGWFCPDYCQYSPDGGKWSLAYGMSDGLPLDPVSSDLRAQLFEATSSGCETAWDLVSCNLGVPIADPLLGRNGWEHLDAWQCYAVATGQYPDGEPGCDKLR